VTLDEAVSSRLGTLGQAEAGAQLGFVPPAADEAILERIRGDHGRLTDVVDRILALDRKGATPRDRLQREAESLANDVQALAIGLVSAAKSQTQALVAQNRSSFADSERLSVAVGVGSIALAVILGFVLSRSLVGPIRRIETRVAEIASGDFSSQVQVANRDELGALAANVNAMNDELGRLYEELETVSKHKSEFLANMSHELRTPLNAIIGFSEVLQQKMFGELNEQQLGYVEDVLDAGKHLLSLINDILDLAKVEAGRMELELADVSIPQALRSGLTMHGERATQAGITLGRASNRRRSSSGPTSASSVKSFSTCCRTGSSSRRRAVGSMSPRGSPMTSWRSPSRIPGRGSPPRIRS
jgi:HAMP domain-containing protein